jgi:phosphatidylserine decarboxylase
VRDGLATRGLILLAALAAVVLGLWLFWRFVWFFRDPPRVPPAAPGIVSAADGIVVYAKLVGPGSEVVSIKRGLPVTLKDLLREEVDQPKVVIGVFMSPFDVHYNRVPLQGRVDAIRRYPALPANAHMGPMHWRTLLGVEPYYEGSTHIVSNERTVTRFIGRHDGEELAYYVVQIGALPVNGIESFRAPGDAVARGETFGMIRVGSQVDLVLPWREGMRIAVKPGERVVAGETLVVY